MAYRLTQSSSTSKHKHNHTITCEMQGLSDRPELRSMILVMCGSNLNADIPHAYRIKMPFNLAFEDFSPFCVITEIR
jgi:hypothetical protein